MSSLGGSTNSGKRLRSRSTVSMRLVDRQRGLRQPGDLVGVGMSMASATSSGPSTKVMCVGRLTRGTHDLFVTFVTDQQDLVVRRRRTGALRGEPWSPAGTSRRSSAATAPPPPRGRWVPLRGRRTPRSSPPGPLRSPRRRWRPCRSSPHHVLVVHDLLAHVDRRPVQLQGLLYGDDRAIDTGAVAPRGGEQHAAGPAAGWLVRLGGHSPIVRATGPCAG